jgi:hypothetical protein
MSAEDFADDEQVIAGQQGVLAGDGFQHMETIQSKVTPGKNGQPSPGYTFVLHCINCSTKNGVEVSWLELVDLSAGAVPMDPDMRRPWIFNKGKATPPCACGRCGKPLFVFMTPDEAQRYVRTGVQMGALPEPAVLQRVHAIRQQQQAAYGQRR